MMTFVNLLTNKVIVSRVSAVSGNKTDYSTITSDASVSIQQMDKNKTSGMGGAIGKTFKLFAEENEDIQVGDKLKDEDGNEYKVTGVTVPVEIGSFIHQEAIIELVK